MTLPRFLPYTLAASLLSLPLAAFSQQIDYGPIVFGFSNSAEWGKDNNKLWPIMAEAGVTAVREFPEWGGVEPSKGNWQWSSADHTLAMAKESGLQIYGFLAFLAPWASTKNAHRTFPMKDPADFGNYAKQCAARYKGQITYWEIWNEFNSPAFGGNGTPKDYAQLLKAAYLGAKQADPQAKIGMGSADVGYSFFEQVIKEGGAGHFDYIAIHPYSVMSALVNGREEAMLGISDNIRALLRKTGQNPNMEIVASEFGVTVSTAPDQEQIQATNLIKGHVLCFAQGIRQTYWFEGRGPDYGKGKTFGVLRTDWSKRPSYYSMKTMTSLLGKNSRHLGWFNPTGKSYGFVFQGATGPVLVMWADGEADQVTFSGAVTITDITGTAKEQADGKVTLTKDPVFITGLDAKTVDQAKANAGQPFPWLKNFKQADSVSIVMGASNVENGIIQLEQGDGKTTTALIDGVHPRRANRNPYIYFDVDDSYAAVGDKQLEVTVVCQPVDAQKGGYIGLTYESSKGYKSVKDGYKVPKTTGWHTHTFKVDDASFGGSWGWNFRFEQAQNVWIKEVTIKRLGAKS